MHNNFYFLRQLSPSLEKAIKGFTLVSCFSQDKDELILEFNDARSSFFIKASLTPTFSCLSFPSHFHRARKNSIDLFPSVTMNKVTAVRQFENERSFVIELENGHHLLFKMHGNRANVIHIQDKNDHDHEIFRNHLKADQEIDLSTLDRSIDWSREYFEQHQGNLKEIYFTFGKEVWRYLNEQDFENLSVDQRWHLVSDIRKKLERPRFYIVEGKQVPSFSLLAEGVVVSAYDDPIEGITQFYSQFMATSAFHLEKSAALRSLEARLVAGLNYIEKNELKLKEIIPGAHYQQWADLIMANMHQIKPGVDKVQLENFYDNNNLIEIRLKKEMNAQRNAEVFYRKAKNQQIEIQKLHESIAAKQKEVILLKQKMVEINNEPELRNIRKQLGEAPAARRTGNSEEAQAPYHEVEYKGFMIWIGKNAVANDIMTKMGHKEDLWLHAKDVSGSHVLIRHQAGKPFPKDVIERAASLAAYHSKRRHDSLCPVTVTPRKFVRKVKGSPAGSVMVDREDVVLVEPAK